MANRNNYMEYYNELSGAFKEQVNQKKKMFKNRGIKFSYQKAFEMFDCDLQRLGKTAKEMASEEDMYVQIYIERWLEYYISRLEKPKLQKIEPIINFPIIEKWMAENREKCSDWLEEMTKKDWFVEMLLDHIWFEDMMEHYEEQIDEIVYDAIQEYKERD